MLTCNMGSIELYLWPDVQNLDLIQDTGKCSHTYPLSSIEYGQILVAAARQEEVHEASSKILNLSNHHGLKLLVSRLSIVMASLSAGQQQHTQLKGSDAC